MKTLNLAMKTAGGLALFLSLNAQAQEVKKSHELGWENGIRYTYKGFNPANIGVKIRPDYFLSEMESRDSSSYYYNPTATTRKTTLESKSLSLGAHVSKEFYFTSYAFFEPYAELGYGFEIRENYGDGSLGAETKTSSNGFYMELGGKPGLMLWKTFKLYTSFGLYVHNANTETSLASQYTSSKGEGGMWSMGYFGDQIDLDTRMFLSVMF